MYYCIKISCKERCSKSTKGLINRLAYLGSFYAALSKNFRWLCRDNVCELSGHQILNFAICSLKSLSIFISKKSQCYVCDSESQMIVLGNVLL